MFACACAPPDCSLPPLLPHISVQRMRGRVRPTSSIPRARSTSVIILSPVTFPYASCSRCVCVRVCICQPLHSCICYPGGNSFDTHPILSLASWRVCSLFIWYFFVQVPCPLSFHFPLSDTLEISLRVLTLFRPWVWRMTKR